MLGGSAASCLPCGQEMHAAHHAGVKGMRPSVQAVNARGAELRIAGLARALRGAPLELKSNDIAVVDVVLVVDFLVVVVLVLVLVVVALVLVPVVVAFVIVLVVVLAVVVVAGGGGDGDGGGGGIVVVVVVVVVDLSPRRARLKPAMRNSAPGAFTACTEGRRPLTPTRWAASVVCPHGRQLAVVPSLCSGTGTDTLVLIHIGDVFLVVGFVVVVVAHLLGVVVVVVAVPVAVVVIVVVVVVVVLVVVVVVVLAAAAAAAVPVLAERRQSSSCAAPKSVSQGHWFDPPWAEFDRVKLSPVQRPAYAHHLRVELRAHWADTVEAWLIAVGSSTSGISNDIRTAARRKLQSCICNRTAAGHKVRRRFCGGGPPPGIRDLVAGICLSVLQDEEEVRTVFDQSWIESWHGWEIWKQMGRTVLP